jgi:hypothetical protein
LSAKVDELNASVNLNSVALGRLDSKIDGVEKSLKSKIGSTRKNLSDKIDRSEQSLKAEIDQVRRENTHNRWIFGSLLVGIFLILLAPHVHKYFTNDRPAAVHQPAGDPASV